MSLFDVTTKREVVVSKPKLSELLFGELGKREFGILDKGQDLALGKWMREKQNEVVNKYRLPDRELRQTDVRKYIDLLYSRAKENGTGIVEFEVKAGEPRRMPNYNRDGNYINIQKPNNDADLKELTRFASDLAHEVVHGIQWRQTPEMSIEEMEMEAYIGVNANPKILDDKSVQSALLFAIKSSASYFREKMNIEVSWM